MMETQPTKRHRSTVRGKFLFRLIVSTFIALSALIFAPQVFASDPSGIQTGRGVDAQTAQGAGIILTKPENTSAPSYTEQLRAYEAFQSQATNEPIAVQLAEAIGQNRVAINLSWVLICGFLVMIMQAGFALVETGLTRAKNSSHTMFMNLFIYPLGILGFWLTGFALMYGAMPVASLGGTPGLDASKEFIVTLFGKPFGLFATHGWFLKGSSYDVGTYAVFLFQTVFMDTTATIPTGSMAERWNLKTFCIYGIFISALLYPIFGNWVWGGGWLAQLGVNFGLGHGFVDFAGSGVVHAVGGMCALAGAIVLGPRIGKYTADGNINGIPGHNIPMALLGALILCFGWFGFNAGSTLGVSGGGLTRVGIIAVATMMASAGGAVSAAIYMAYRSGRPDPTMVANGMLAGLVGITGCSGFVDATAGVVIGAVSGVLVCISVEVIERLSIDDPVGAISVHGVCGLWGVLAAGIFPDGTAVYNGSWNGVAGSVKGMLYGGGSQMVAQLVACIAIVAWGFGISFVFFKALNSVIPLRVPPEVEIEGLDTRETGVTAYPDFATFQESNFTPLSNTSSNI
ncbi:ammonium transporter [Leptolyngbya sp. AN03gr2]|uniref:ammonium transporter n=1 Tax=unclassified Leptolyngbya TaxID=2650499 RepID=UPI003D317A8D